MSIYSLNRLLAKKRAKTKGTKYKCFSLYVQKWKTISKVQLHLFKIFFYHQRGKSSHNTWKVDGLAIRVFVGTTSLWLAEENGDRLHSAFISMRRTQIFQDCAQGHNWNIQWYIPRVAINTSARLIQFPFIHWPYLESILGVVRGVITVYQPQLLALQNISTTEFKWQEFISIIGALS